MEVSILLDVAAGLGLANRPLTFRATLRMAVLKNSTGAGTGILETPRRVLFWPHSAAMDAAAYRRRAMELAPTRGLEPLSPEGRRFSGPLQ